MFLTFLVHFLFLLQVLSSGAIAAVWLLSLTLPSRLSEPPYHLLTHGKMDVSKSPRICICKICSLLSCDLILFILYVMPPLELPWYIGVNVRLSPWEFGYDAHHCPVLLPFSKTLHPHCCSRPTCMNGGSVGCKCYCGWVGIRAPLQWPLTGMLPREWKKYAVSAELILNPMTGVIIHWSTLM